MHFSNNIKIIRELTGKNQEEFSRLIGTKLSNLKTYETKNTIPRSILLLNKIADIAGITADELINKHFQPGDLTVKVDKVENNLLSMNRDDIIIELKRDKERAEKREDRIMDQLASNLSAMMQLLAALSRHDHAFHETILKSLSRLEGNKSDLIAEARSYEALMQVKESLQDNNAQSRNDRT